MQSIGHGIMDLKKYTLELNFWMKIIYISELNKNLEEILSQFIQK
jgi:hypothetical protein